MIEPNKRYEIIERDEKKFRQIKYRTICHKCWNSIVRPAKIAEPVVVYGCRHQYHASCLGEKLKDNGNKKCPICLTFNYMAVREEKEKLE